MFYRVTKMTNQVFAVPFEECDLDLEVERKHIISLVRNGEAVLLCDDLEAAAEVFNVSVDEIIVDSN